MKEARGRQGEEKHGGRRERESKASNERRSRHKVNRYGPCSSQGSTALRTPRRLYFLSSSHPFLPSLYQRPSHRLWLSLMLAMRIEHHSFQTKVCRRGSALFLHSSIPETPDSFSLLNHAFLREREGERSVEVYFFCFIFLLSFYYLSFYYLLSCSKGYCSIFVVVALFCFEKEFGTAKAGLRAVGNHRIVEFKMEKRWSVVSHGWNWSSV